MNIDDLTVRQARELFNLFGQNTSTHEGEIGQKPDHHVWEIGEKYLIRTVTMINTGRLVSVTEHELVIEGAAWIADTGRFADALLDSDFTEVEPFPNGRVIVGRGAIVDAVQIKTIPRKQK